MASSKIPGVQGSDRDTTNVMDGTLSKQESPKPGILNKLQSFASGVGGLLVEAGGVIVEAGEAVYDTGDAWVGTIGRAPSAAYSALIGTQISFELADAVNLRDASTSLTGLSQAERHVHAWLRQYKDDMVNREAQYKIDRRAIAGAISWEALQNVQRDSVRAVGPGKVHILTGKYGGTDHTVAKEVEDLGYVKQESFHARESLLKTAQGAIEYISAIMGALADKAANYQYQIRCNPPILTTAYQAWDIPEWGAHLNSKFGQPLEPAAMGAWVRDHMDYLTDAVGVPALPCASNEAELRRQGWKVNARIERNTNTAFA